MSSRPVSLWSITLNQYIYKLKSASGLILGLVAVQLIGLFLSLDGMGSSGMGSEYVSVQVQKYSAYLPITLSMIWAFVAAIQLTTKPYKKMDFTLVSNRLTANLSNTGVLITFCILGGITASLTGILLRLICYFLLDRSQLIASGFYLSPADLVLGIGVAILYMTLVSAAGYLIGQLTQIHMIFAFLIPALLFGSILTNPTNLFSRIVQFFTEPSLPLFTGKVVGVVIALFALSALLSNRLEVRR